MPFIVVILFVGACLFLKEALSGSRIKKLRKSARLRQEELAKKLGVSWQTMLAIENDKYDPTLKLAMKIEKALYLHVDELVFPMKIQQNNN